MSSPDTDSTPKLKRALGPWLLLLYGLGSTIGAGIYALTGKIIGASGYFAPLSFLVAAILASFSALSFAELSSRFPKSAGEAVYVREGLRVNWLSMLTGLIVAFTGIISTAALFKGFAGYLATLLPISTTAALILAAFLLAGLAIAGIRESVSAAAIITLAEIFGLILIIAVSMWHLGEATPQLPDASSFISINNTTAIMAGAFLAFYAMIGFEDLVNVAEEVKDVQKNMKRAIFATLVITTLLYMAVAVSALLWLDPQTLAETDAPLALVYQQITGQSPTIISIIAVFAVINGGMINIVMASRVFYGMSRLGQLPKLFGKVHPRVRTPVNAILITTALVLVLALGFPLEQLARITAGLALAVFTLVNFSLIMIKRRETDNPAYKMSIIIPIIGAVVSAAFLTWEIAQRLG